MDEKIEPLRIASLRGLDFLVDNLGCTVSTLLP